MIDEDNNNDEFSPEEIILQQWLDFEESDEPSDTKQDKILNFLESSLVDKPATQNGVYKNVLALGGKLLCHLSFLPIGGKGHFEVTKIAFNNCFKNQLTPTAINNFALASRYSDLYYPDLLHYHAMSQVGADHFLLDKSGHQDIHNFTSLLNHFLTSLDSALLTSDINSIFFYTGMLFHSIQDLVVHRGMTSPEHAYHNKKGTSPDDPEKAPELAQLISDLFIKDFIRPRFTKNPALFQLLNHAGKLTASSYKQIDDRKQEIKNSKFTGNIPLIGTTLSHTHFLLSEARSFTSSYKFYDVDKNAITWHFMWDEGHDLIQSVNETLFSHLPKSP